MPNRVKILVACFALIFIGAATVLAHSAIEGSKPIEITADVARADGALPPLPTIGMPGSVTPEEELLDVEPETAKEINDARPFSTEMIVAAAPYTHLPSGDDGERAIACLATAGWFEAGPGSGDQSAVMQVVLNRVRHPAFPNSVCGVVFQGSERRTGCQFSFTCDGAMLRRRPSASAWQAALGLSRAMLTGHIDERVGLATHFHTDWVVPYWSSALVKLTNVRTHLFFRWDGFWGTRAAFRQHPMQTEPTIAAMAALSSVHRANALTEADPDETDLNDQSEGAVEADSEAPTSAPPVLNERESLGMQNLNQVALRRLDLPAGATAGRWALDAVSLCADEPVCRVLGWSNRARAPANLTRETIAASPPDLVFVKVSRDRRQQAHWNCEIWPRASTSRCLGSAESVENLLFAE